MDKNVLIPKVSMLGGIALKRLMMQTLPKLKCPPLRGEERKEEKNLFSASRDLLVQLASQLGSQSAADGTAGSQFRVQGAIAQLLVASQQPLSPIFLGREPEP